MSRVETKRLILETFQRKDVETYYHILKEKSVYQWLGNGHGPSQDKVLKIIDNDSKHWDKYHIGTWAVKLKDDGKIIGHCGFNYIEALDAFELLYALDKDYWYKGYASEAARASLTWLIEHSNLDRVIALSYPDNERSIKVINKLGFQYIEQKKLFGHMLNVYEKRLKQEK